MLDSGFIGHFPIGATVPLALQCRTKTLAVAEPTGTPSYTVIRPDGYIIKTGVVSTNLPTLTGFRLASLELTSTTDWQPGVLYTVIFSYLQGGDDRASMSTFQVA